MVTSHTILWVATIAIMGILFVFGSSHVPGVTEQREEYLVAAVVVTALIVDRKFIREE